jgi:acetyl-CoA acetyltransferase
MTAKSLIAGVGMIPFRKPGESASYDLMGAEAARLALQDAGLQYRDVQHSYVGYVYGDSTSGQSALYHVGLSGVPIFNVNNNCASGSTALFLARQAIEHGVVDVALALGFEEMSPGPLVNVFPNRRRTCDRHLSVLEEVQPWDDSAPGAAQLFGGAGREYMNRFGVKPESFAKIAVKSRRHAARNPYAVFRREATLEEVLGSRPIYDFLTRDQCCPPTCGAAAAVLVSSQYARRNGLSGLVEIVAQTMTTDRPVAFETRSVLSLIGYEMAQQAAATAYEQAGIGPQDLDVVELHDCFTVNELITYEALGLARPGEAERMVWDDQNTYGGDVVVNPSGGLLSKGHPLGATGLAQCAELVWQLRGAAGERQVPAARYALQHNGGMGGACVVGIYRRAT